MKIHGRRIEARHLLRPSKLIGVISNRPVPQRMKPNTLLRFLNEVMGLERFNYGLWDGEALTKQGLETAQARYAELLASWVPEGVKSILDVGCGVGTDTLELHRRGYDVEGLSPDPFQQQQFVARTGLPFHLAFFQDFKPARAFDLVRMSESAQYVWLDNIFDSVRAVAPGGHLLLSDYFVIDPDLGEISKSGHPLATFTERAEASGFELLREQDITDAVLPTLELANVWLDRYVDPSLDILQGSFGGRHPRIAAAVFKRVQHGYAKMRHKLDPQLFRAAKRYLVRLYRVPGSR